MMKVSTRLLILGCTLLFSLNASASHRVISIQSKINKVFYKACIKKLKLAGEQKERTLAVFKLYDGKKAKELDTLFHLTDELKEKQSQKKPVSDFVLSDMIKRILDARLELVKIEQQRISKLQEVLSQQQVATYLILSKKMDDKISDLVLKDKK